jgi:hypothetical protein
MLQLASNRLHSWLSGGGVWAPQVRGHPALPRAEDWPILARGTPGAHRGPGVAFLPGLGESDAVIMPELVLIYVWNPYG